VASLAAAAASLSLPAAAAIPDYAQNFDSLLPADDASGNTADDLELDNDGWLLFGAVFSGQDASGNPTNPGSFIYQYGSYEASIGGAPNTSTAFSGVVVDTADPSGNQFINVFSDYLNADHAGETSSGGFPPTTTDHVVQSTILREYTIDSSDMGKTITLQFDARRPDDGFAVGDPDQSGNPNGTCEPSGNACFPSSAQAFIKTLDPDASFATTNLVVEDMTNIAKGLWQTFTLELPLTNPALEGQIFQIGFESYSSNFDTTGVNYDNVNIITSSANIPIPPLAIALGGGLLGLLGIYGVRKRAKG